MSAAFSRSSICTGPPLAAEPPLSILQRIERERRALGGAEAILAFDADGTLWSGDVGVDLFETLLARSAVREPAHAALVAEAQAFGVPADGDATRVAAALYQAFQQERYPEDRAFAMMAWALAGYRSEETAALAREVIRQGKLDERIHARIRPILDWACREGVAAYVVSASVKVIVIEAAGKLGIPPSQIVATEPATRDGMVLAEIEGLAVFGDQKVPALRRARPHAVILAAFGDSGFDAPMLRQARVAVAVLPKPDLLARAASIPGLVALGE
jgi:phosphoserine phosphatase